MSYVYSHRGDLLIAGHASDERSIQRQLKEIDRTLVLTWERDPATERPVWNVHKTFPDRDAIQVLTWRDERTLEPLPLSSSLVDEVKRLREVDTMKQIDAANARLRARAEQQARTDALDLAADHAPYVDRGRVQITTADVRRPKPYWLRNRHLRGLS